LGPPIETQTTQTGHPKNAHTTWLRWFGSILSVGLLIYLLSQQGWAEIAYVASQIAWWRFVLAIILVFISRLAVVMRWHVLMYFAGTGITIRQSTRLTFAMLFASNFLPTTIGGDVVRLAGAIRMGFDQAISVASLVVDRLVGMTGMAMALFFGLPVFIQYVTNSPVTESMAIPWLSLLADKILRFLHGLTQALKVWLRKPRSLLGALAFTWIHMLCTFSTVWLLLRGMGEDIPYWSVMGLWSATYFVTLLPISINGLGVQELAMTYFYVAIGGISPSSGLTLALLMRVLQMIASLPGALFIPDIIAGKK
jgi:glycosyltransferase 2 family protein